MEQNPKFQFPVSTLVGSTITNFFRITKGKRIDKGFQSRYYWTILAGAILDLFGKGKFYLPGIK
ncbi:MAG: hypothetical protein R2764_22005 [Bacteroidales bacterium]